MRQGQKGNRGRNRGRKPQNPVNRVFESNGPDVKIRGNAAHVAERYNTLARDALVSGNTITAENYFQHAEHYQRILAAAQAYNQQQQERANGGGEETESSESQGRNDGRWRGGRRQEQRGPGPAETEEETVNARNDADGTEEGTPVAEKQDDAAAPTEA